MKIAPIDLDNGVVRLCRNSISILSLVLIPMTSARADVNSWINPSSGNWEDQSSWSLGVIPDSTQFIEFTNAGWKALAIGPNTAQNFPQSMQIQGMQIASPTNSFNVLLLNFSGFAVPLQMTSLNVGTNSSIMALSSMLEVNTDTNGNGGNVILNGTVDQGDSSGVAVQGSLRIWDPVQFASDIVAPAAYELTNGSLTVGGGEYIGGMQGPAQFVQYGGVQNVGGNIGQPGSLVIDTGGEFDLYGGQLTVTNGIVDGSGDFADGANFFQYGGSVNADLTVGGNYSLSGGTLTGHFVMGDGREDANVTQTGGTNFAVSMDLGHPDEFGDAAFYTLSNGVIHVDTSVMFGNGQFTQLSGQNTIVSNLVMYGGAVEVGIDDSVYLLDGGSLSVGGLTMELDSVFQQNGGTNDIAGDLVLAPAPPPQSGFLQTDEYELTNGFLSARNVIVNGAVQGGFLQSGGSNQITGQLTLQGLAPEAYYYTLEGGTLAVNDIDVCSNAFFQHTSGIIIQSGTLTLSQGEWRAANGDTTLGPLQLTGPLTNLVTFPNGSSILRLANSSGQTWDSSATLIVTNWHGSATGGGDSQLYFGSNTNGLTAQQLAQIKFSVAGESSPARILDTGEVVPNQEFTFSISGNTMDLTWGPGWTLQSSTNVAGPFQDVPGAVSPYSAPMTNSSEFFRLRE